MWSTREYYDRNDGNFQNYYYEQLKEASYILPKMSEYEKNYIIIKQFPWWVQEALASANFADTNSIAQTLANLDAIRSEKQARRENRQFIQTENFKNTNQQNVPQTVNVRRIQTNNQNRNNYNYQNNRRYNKRYNNNSNYRNVVNNQSNASHDDNFENMLIPRTYNVNLPDTRYPPPITHTNYNPTNQNNDVTHVATNVGRDHLD